jgi:Cro/C1-type HTH DNA-binding domain
VYLDGLPRARGLTLTELSDLVGITVADLPPSRTAEPKPSASPHSRSCARSWPANPPISPPTTRTDALPWTVCRPAPTDHGPHATTVYLDGLPRARGLTLTDLADLTKLCQVLACQPADLLTYDPD